MGHNFKQACRDYSFPQHIMGIEYNLAENFVKNEKVPSLKQIALSKISKSLVNNLCMKLLNIEKSENSSPVSASDMIADRLNSKETLQSVINFSIPKVCKMEIISMFAVIRSQVSKYFVSLERLKILLNPERIKVCLNYLHWSIQDTVNYVSTISALIEKSNLSEYEKHLLAGTYCLDEKAKYFKIPTAEQREKCHDEELHMWLFWTSHINSKENWFREIVRKYANSLEQYDNNVYLYLLKWAAKRENEVAFQYIWMKFSPNWMKESITYIASELFVKIPINLNIVCYLMSQINNLEDSKQFIECCGSIVLDILDRNSRWREYFLNTSEYMISFVPEFDFHYSLQIISFCVRVNGKSLRHYMRLVYNSERINQVKNLFKYETILPMLYYLQIKHDADLFSKLLTIDNFIDWKLFLYSENGLKLGVILARKEAINLFEMFLSEIFLDNIESKKYHYWFFKMKGLEVCTNSFLDNRTKMLNFFLTLFCEDKENFKRLLPFVGEGSIIGTMLDERKVASLASMERYIDLFILWCFNHNEEETRHCKSILFERNSSYINSSEAFLNYVNFLIANGDRNYTKRFLKWAFSTDENIRNFKWFVVFDSISNEPDLNKFEMFLNGFTEEEIMVMYDDILNYKVNHQLLIGKLISECKFKPVNNLLNFKLIFDNDMVIIQYKEYVMYQDGVRLFYDWSCRNWDNQVKELIKWFNPCQISALAFQFHLLYFILSKFQGQQCKSTAKVVEIKKYIDLLFSYCLGNVKWN